MRRQPKTRYTPSRKNSPGDRPTIGLSMIVKNGGEDLRKCLQSAAPLVSQIIVADTGSTDNTKEIAAEMGATVIDVPWTNDFAAARNAALEHITTDWVLSLDADEELSAESLEQIPRLLAKAEGVGGFLTHIRNYFSLPRVIFHGIPSTPNTDSHPRAANAPSWGEHVACRLFRRHPEIRFEGRVHEMVEYTIPNSGLTIRNAKVQILHFGPLAEAEMQNQKAHFYLELANEKVKEHPKDAKAWLELGIMEMSEFGHYEKAIDCFEKSVAISADTVEAWQWLCHAQHYRGEHELGLEVYRRMVEGKIPIPYLLYVWTGDYLHDQGQFEEALECYQKALGGYQGKEFTTGYVSPEVVKSRIGYLEVRLGRREGIEKIKQALIASPNVPENHDRLVKAQVLIGDLKGAAEAAVAEAAKFPVEKLFVRAAALCVKADRADLAREVLNAGRPYFTSEHAYEKAASSLA